MASCVHFRERAGTVQISSDYEIRMMALASYNSRVDQGIVHTPGYVEQMRVEQEWFDTVRHPFMTDEEWEFVRRQRRIA